MVYTSWEGFETNSLTPGDAGNWSAINFATRTILQKEGSYCSYCTGSGASLYRAVPNSGKFQKFYVWLRFIGDRGNCGFSLNVDSVEKLGIRLNNNGYDYFDGSWTQLSSDVPPGNAYYKLEIEYVNNGSSTDVTFNIYNSSETLLHTTSQTITATEVNRITLFGDGSNICFDAMYYEELEEEVSDNAILMGCNL